MQSSNHQASEDSAEPLGEFPVDTQAATSPFAPFPTGTLEQQPEVAPPGEETIIHEPQAPLQPPAYEIQPGLFYPPPPAFYEQMQKPVEKQPLPGRPVSVFPAQTVPLGGGGPVYQPQMAYQPYPAPPFPGGVPPARRSRKWLWITLSILGGTLLLCGLCSWAAYGLVGNDIQGAFAVPNLVTDYYQDIQQGNYQAAYTDLQVNGLTQSAFMQEATQQDSKLGSISSFELASASPNVTTSGNNTAISSYSVVVTTVRRNISYNIHLTIQEIGQNWKITALDTI
jgi:hypothetical protein